MVLINYGTIQIPVLFTVYLNIYIIISYSFHSNYLIIYNYTLIYVINI